ncbi:hypothetical protein M3Y99_00540200 [Aphelenchoides fujianensis]|nr:hypothetical protein M3Y99_00540200 [Aphelenchoides fujianensis]
MAASCKHSTFLSTVQSVEYRGTDVQSPKCELPFRPGTNFSLVLTKHAFGKRPDVKIAIEGSADGSKGALWVSDERGQNSIPPWNAQLNKNYTVSLSPNYRVFCTLWTEECPFCKHETAQQEADHEEKLQTLRSQLEQTEDRLAEQQLQASGLHSLDHPLRSFQNESIKEEMAAEIAALEQQKQAGEAAVVSAKEAFGEEQKKLAVDIAEAAAAEMRALADKGSSRVSF